MGLIRKNAILWAMGSALAALSTAAAAQADGLIKADLDSLAQIDAAAGKGDCDSILKQSEPLVARRQRALPNDLAASLYELMASCHVDADRLDQAYAIALRGTALAESSPKLWYIRLQVERSKKLYSEAATTLEAMIQGQGAALNELRLQWLGWLVREMKDAGAAEARTRALKLLASDSFAPSATFGSNDGFRFLFAQDRLAAGDTAAAAPAVAGLSDPFNIAMASLDPKMRGYLRSIDIAAAAAKMLARHQEWMARQPDRLRPLVAAAENLRQLGRAKEALELLRTAEPRLDKLSAAEDADDVNWWWNDLAITYEALRQPDEAVKAYRMGMAASEDGQANVSQVINLALAQLRFGRPADALATLATKDVAANGASPYGNMLYRQARSCAYHFLGRDGDAAADVEFVKAHEKDAQVAVTHMFLCLATWTPRRPPLSGGSTIRSFGRRRCSNSAISQWRRRRSRPTRSHSSLKRLTSGRT